MSILDRLFGKRKASLIALTELGKKKSDDAISGGGIRLKIVSYLDEHGESSLQELSSNLSYPLDQIKASVNKLYREGWVTTVKNSSD